MTTLTLFAYLPEDFGGSLPADPLAAAQTVAGVPLTLARSANPVAIVLTDGVLAAPACLGGRTFEAGTPARETWTLSDVAKGVRLVGYDLRPGQGADPGLGLIASALPLKPGQVYQLSLPHADGMDGWGFFGGFAAGTRILTEAGKRPIEDIGVGEKIWTEGAGFQPVIWRGVQAARARGQAAPVRLRRGLLGLSDDLLIAGTQAVRIEAQGGPVLVPAASFVAAGQATRDFGTSVTWHQLLLPGHAVIFAHALACESFWPRAWAGPGPVADWPDGYSPPDSPVHPRLTEAEAARLLG